MSQQSRQKKKTLNCEQAGGDSPKQIGMVRCWTAGTAWDNSHKQTSSATQHKYPQPLEESLFSPLSVRSHLPQDSFPRYKKCSHCQKYDDPSTAHDDLQRIITCKLFKPTECQFNKVNNAIVVNTNDLLFYHTCHNKKCVIVHITMAVRFSSSSFDLCNKRKEENVQQAKKHKLKNLM